MEGLPPGAHQMAVCEVCGALASVDLHEAWHAEQAAAHVITINNAVLPPAEALIEELVAKHVGHLVRAGGLR